jgi:hypothetical protein
MKVRMEPPPAISPEQNREMVCWIRKILAGEASFLERLTPDDWARFIAFAQKHGIAPVLYHAIKDSPPGSLSKHTLHELRSIYLGSVHRNMVLYHELGKILRALKAADVPVIVLKGACLAEAVYGNVALRSMGDVDFLVKKGDMVKAVQVLGPLGYSAGYDFQVENERSVHRHLPPLRGPQKLPIEVHWTILGFTDFDTPDEKEIVKIWERARPLVVEGTPCLMLAPEDLLLHLCIHISRQNLFNMRLRGFLDLSKVVAYYGHSINWDVMQQRACHWRVDRAVRLTIFLADRWVGLELPDGVKQAWKPDRPDPDVMNWIERKMLAETPSDMGGKLLEFIAGKSIRGKVGILWRRFFPPRAMLARHYKVDPGGGKIYFFYPVRWFSLCRRFGPTVWKAWKGDITIVTPLQKENALKQWLAQG